MVVTTHNDEIGIKSSHLCKNFIRRLPIYNRYAGNQIFKFIVAVFFGSKEFSQHLL